MLGHPRVEHGISDIRRVPRNDRTKANLRFYCDNDRLVGGRWTLKADPPLEQWTRDYFPQALRPLITNARVGQPYQEWEDRYNGILMGMEIGCNKDRVQAQSYTQRMAGAWTPEIRSTMTVCLS